MLKKYLLGLIAATLMAFLTTTVSALAQGGCLAYYLDIGPAANYAVFALNTTGGEQTAYFSSVTANGNVGIASKGHLSLGAPSTINGDLYINSVNGYAGRGVMNGEISLENLSMARDAAIWASYYATWNYADYSCTGISKSLTVTGYDGLTVIDVYGSIDLNNATLTLDGSEDSVFIINVAGWLRLSGRAGIVTTGGVLPSNVLINMTGSGRMLSTHVGSIIDGIVLGPDIGGTVYSTNGSLILGRNFTLTGRATVNYQPPSGDSGSGGSGSMVPPS